MYVNNSASYKYMEGYMIDRELLEKEALAEVCACWYYDLADTLQETPDEGLRDIIQYKSAYARHVAIK